MRPYLPENDVAGPYDGTGNDNEWGQRYADILTRIMNADLTVIPAAYDRAAIGAYPGGVTALSWGEIDQFWIGLRAALPSARFTIHHAIGRHDPMMSPRAAVRWSLDGTLDGWGVFGAPSGARVHVMGLSHAEFGTLGKAAPTLRRDFTLFDETAIWKQILLQTGDL